MITLNKTISSKQKQGQNTLSVGSNRISGTMLVFKFRDKDTRQIIHYTPCLELNGYGSDETKSFEMIKFSINDFFDHLMSLSSKKREKELNELGWKKSSLKNKEFSKLFIDINGELKSFNAVADEVELLTLQA